MGKHKHKSKKHKREKRGEKQKRKYSSSSEDEWVEKKMHISSESEKQIDRRAIKSRCSSSSDSDEWVSDRDQTSESSSKRKVETKNKKINCDSDSDDNNALNKPRHESSFEEKNQYQRDEWMNLSSSFLTSSNSLRRQKRDEEKRLEREKQQYNPRECSRELNPYWKDGGDGLPTFKKPKDFDETQDVKFDKRPTLASRQSNWKKRDTEKQQIKTNKKQALKSEEKNDNISDQGNTLSEKEMNLLAAKLVKAEIMGNTKLVNELKEKLENARNVQKCASSTEILKEDDVLLTHTDSRGLSKPVRLQSEYGESSKPHKKKNINTHKDGQRVRYFADDDKYSLKEMFENEKYNSVEDQNSEFLRMVSKVHKNDDMDDIFSDNIRKKESDVKTDSRNRDRAINEHRKVSESLDSCNKCIQSKWMLKHLMISMGETTYLSLPSYEPLAEGHCFIVPIRHVPCSTQLDENEWSDICDMRKSLVNLFMRKDEVVLFFETAVGLHRFPHMYIECVPLPREEGDMAPIYFKKAIDESEMEWAQNKKLISLKGRNIRKAVPKGLPYFSVSFGMEEGFAHVIEDEESFPMNFAQEIIGGMLDLHHSKWRKPRKQSFDEQSKRVLEFSKEWKDFDCTI